MARARSTYGDHTAAILLLPRAGVGYHALKIDSITYRYINIYFRFLTQKTDRVAPLVALAAAGRDVFAMMPLPSWVADQTKALRSAVDLATEQAAAIGQKVSHFDMGFDEGKGGPSSSATDATVATAPTAGGRDTLGSMGGRTGKPNGLRLQPAASPAPASPLPVASLPQPQPPSRRAPVASQGLTRPAQPGGEAAPAADGLAASRQMLALREELDSTKLRALRKIKEQEAHLEQLRLTIVAAVST